MIKLCAPALIYIIFSLTHIIIDTFKGLYNTAFFKFIVSILITILLDSLCKGGMGIISWIIVFIPFIFMTVIVSILLFIFGLDISNGKINLNCINKNHNIVDSVKRQTIYPINVSSDPAYQT
jgi:ABC-type polysaccharide transport system permease subunit